MADTSCISIAAGRAELALHATMHTAALAGLLRREFEDADWTDANIVGHELIRRIEQLTDVVLDTLDTQEMPLEHMRAILLGARAAGG